jgi:GAF domain-containing protein
MHCRTQSEIVVPVICKSGCLLGVLDVDSDRPAAFTAADQSGLEAVAGLLEGFDAEGMPGYRAGADLETST